MSRTKFVLIDIDGTIAEKHPDRDIFNYELVHMDYPINQTIEVINCLLGQKNETLTIKLKNNIETSIIGYQPIFLSGRSEDCRQETIEWLQKYLKVDHTNERLYMRSSGDYRKDHIVKKELLYQFMEDYQIIKDDIFCVFDDRLSVIQMWINEGLFVFNVNNGKGDF